MDSIYNIKYKIRRVRCWLTRHDINIGIIELYEDDWCRFCDEINPLDYPEWGIAQYPHRVYDWFCLRGWEWFDKLDWWMMDRLRLPFWWEF